MGATLPTVTQVLMNIAGWAGKFGVYVFLFLILMIIGIVLYRRTPGGRIKWDQLVLRTPVIGPIVQLNELSRSCRTVSMLIKVGLPLPDIITMCIQSSNNKIIGQALSDVKEDMMRGEGLSQPMSKRPLFLPLMVQMAAVGEKTGNLGNTMSTVAESYEFDADDKTSTAIGLLQPAMTIGLAVVVGFIVVAMISAMYGVYGQLG
jgi:type IV pilus assembly protein PilC